MTSKENENGTDASGADAQPPAGETPCCGPDCGCGPPAGGGGRKLKIAVCLAVAVAVLAILLYKVTDGRRKGGGGFSVPCSPLPSIAALDKMAANLDSVFLIVPGKDNAPPAAETGAALAAVGKTLLAKGVRTSVYTLEPGSPDYPNMAGQVTPPGIAVLTKGKGIGVVSGAVTETSLMQAYVASTSGGGCGGACPPGGASSGKCP